MRAIVRTTQFSRDVRLLARRGLDLAERRQLVSELAASRPLAPRHRDHKLSGSLRGYRECHVRPDWLLLDKLTGSELILVRTGSHADLFRE